MTDTDLLALVRADIEARAREMSLPKLPELPDPWNTQDIDFAHSSKTSRTSMVLEEGRKLEADDALPNDASRAIKESARAKPFISEKSGSVEEPIKSTVGPGRNLEVLEVLEEEDRAADLIALFDERAAIREFEGGFSRPMAQSFALDDCINELTGHSPDRQARDEALAMLRAAGIMQPVLFDEGETADAPF